MTTAVVYRTIREQIADHIRTDVLIGDLAPGERLREQDLAARYGVSRGPIRDALLQLTQEGALVAKPNCGVTVSHPPREEIQSLIVELRRHIELFAVREITGHLGEAELSDLAAHGTGLRAACEAGDFAAVVRHDMAFHRCLIARAGSDLVDLWLPIVVRMLLHYTRHENLMDNYREHEAILAALRAGDTDGAVEAVERNIQ